MRRRVVGLLVASVAVGASCAAPPELPLTLFLSARPRAIDDQGQQALLIAQVSDSENKPRGGTVFLSAAAGAFEAGGKQASFELDSNGQGSVRWLCAVNRDPGCAGDVRLEARWESGADFLVQVTRLSVGPVDAGTDAGAPDGGSPDGGAPDGGAAFPLDPGGVLLLGTLQEGACDRGALADPGQPTRVALGFGCDTGQAMLSGGSLYYLEGQARVLRRFVPELPTRATFGTGYVYPLDPLANDPQIPTPGCAQISRFRYAPDGKLFYECASGQRFIDGRDAGHLAGAQVLALGAGGLALLSGGLYSGLSLAEADGGLTPVDAGTALWQALARAHPQGFQVARTDSNPAELYQVQRDGTAVLVGPFAAPPAGLNNFAYRTLDGDGGLWALATQGLADVVVRVPLAPGQAALVYDEANATAQDWAVYPPKLYLRIHGSDLVTGP